MNTPLDYTQKLTRSTLALKIGSFQFLPTGLHGLCFGCCFSGPLPLRSLTNGSPIGVRFRESLVIRLYPEIDQIHLSIEAQCVTTLLHVPLGDCHRFQNVSWGHPRKIMKERNPIIGLMQPLLNMY